MTGFVYAADETGRIFSIGDNGKSTLEYKTGQSVIGFCFTPDNEMVLITRKGIYFPATKKLYDQFEDAYSNVFIQLRHNSLDPSTFFIDRSGNIWLGFSMGEWGGDAIEFSTSKKKFIAVGVKHCSFQSVRSFFQVDSSIYATNSLQHMSMISSEITDITHSCRALFLSPLKTGGDSDLNLYDHQPLYMGPAVYNSKDNSVYFYSQHGIFRGDMSNKYLLALQNWKRILKPKLLWYYGMPDAVGYGMNVTKMFFANDNLVVVSPDNGILVWDGRNAVLFKTLYQPKD